MLCRLTASGKQLKMDIPRVFLLLKQQQIGFVITQFVRNSSTINFTSYNAARIQPPAGICKKYDKKALIANKSLLVTPKCNYVPDNLPESPAKKLFHEEGLPHFKSKLHGSDESAQESTKQKETAPLAHEPTHPDIQEAKGMHEGGYRLPHPIWNASELESVKITHKPPVNKIDKAAYYTVKLFRTGFDIFSGYTIAKYRGTLDEKQWLKRIIFLETVAGVPGMVGAMVRHLVSLRKMKRDHGWIHTLLEEAENERMHLMTALRIANPGIFMRISIAGAQGIFVSMFSLAYLISPRFCHRFVGYLEEEAVITYTSCLEAIDNKQLKMWSRMKAPEIAIEYWKLPEDAMMRDVILAIRADEAHHRAVNHTLGSKKTDDTNPYKPGE